MPKKNSEHNQSVAAGRCDQSLQKIPAFLRTSAEFAGAAWWSGRSFINNHNRFDFMAKAEGVRQAEWLPEIAVLPDPARTRPNTPPPPTRRQSIVAQSYMPIGIVY